MRIPRNLTAIFVRKSEFSTCIFVKQRLDKFRRKFKGRLGDAFILYTKDLMVKDGIRHLPLYMAMFL